MMRSLLSLMMMVLVAISFAAGAAAQQTQPVFKDPRDGQAYPLVELGGMTWFARNLNFESRDSFCYDNRAKNCSEYGRLYRWEAALAACPEGSHMSTEYEWQVLELELGVPFGELAARGNRGTRQGALLKKGGGTGFNTQYGGWRRSEDGGYEALGKNAAFWTSTESDLEEAWHRDIDTGDDMIFRSRVIKPYGLSVRCVLNRSDKDSK